MRKLLDNKPGFSYFLQCLLYVLFFAIFAKHYFYSIGPDYVNYYGIATQYSSGNFYSAVNTWWSPLFSWLMIPFVKLGVAALWVNKIIQLIAGVYFLYVIQYGLLFFLKNKLKNYFGILLLPFILYWSLISDTPDFLSAALLLHFFFLLVRNENDFSLKKVIQLSLLAGLCYLAKSFNFYFIICFSVAAIGIHFYWKRKINLKYLALFSATFFCIIICWVASMYWRSSEWMITSRAEAAPCNITIANKKATNIQLYDCAGLGIDKNSQYSNWEQPYLYNTINYQESFLSQENLGRKWATNAVSFFKNYISKYQLGIMIILTVLLYRKKNRMSLYFIAYYCIYLGGHFFFHLEPRFFIMPSVLMMLGVMILTDKYFRKQAKEKYLSLAMIVLGALFFRTPIVKLKNFETFDTLAQVKDFSDKQNIPSGKRIATEMGLFEQGLFLAFFTNNQCIGSLTTDAIFSQKELVLNQAHYLLKYENNKLQLVKLPMVNPDTPDSR